MVAACDAPGPTEGSVLMGFDYGERRTGVAVGQTLTGTATPVATLDSRRGQPDWAAIMELIEQWRPHTLVVGAPPAGRLVDAVQRFRNELARRFAGPVHTVNEAYSSLDAYRRLSGQRAAGRRGRIAKHEIDSMAAALVLETWLAGRASPRARERP